MNTTFKKLINKLINEIPQLTRINWGGDKIEVKLEDGKSLVFEDEKNFYKWIVEKIIEDIDRRIEKIKKEVGRMKLSNGEFPDLDFYIFDKYSMIEDLSNDRRYYQNLLEELENN